MDCTPEQIEQKRRIALAKLQAKKIQFNQNNSNLNQNNGHNLTFNSKNTSKFNQNQSPNTNNNFNIPNASNSSSNHLYFNPNNSNNTGKNSSPFKNGYQPKVLSNVNNKLHDDTPSTKPGMSPGKFFGGKVVTGTTTMISENRFEVTLSVFNEKARDVFKTIPSRQYDPKTKQWNFDIKDYTILLTNIQRLKPEVVVGQLPVYLTKLLENEKKYVNDVDLSRIDDLLLGSLLPFQKEGVIFGINRKGRLLIADDMGLGKTFQALAIANYYKEDWPLLIVTTSSMRHTWQETIQQYVPSVPLMSVQYMNTGKDYIKDSNVLIVSRDMFTRSVDKLLEKKFGVMVIDESHEFKNFKTKAAKCATMLARKAKRVILLSGTPALSRPNELFTQLSFIDERFFGDFFEYSKRYCNGQQTNFGWDSSGKSNLTELEIVLSKKFMIRRTKSEVLQALPSKSREVIKLDLSLSQISDEEQKLLDGLVRQYKATKKGHDKHSALLSLFSETANIKIPSVCKYILKVLQEKTKFLVFAHHQKMLDAVGSILLKNKISFIRIDGSTTPDQRNYFINKFQNQENCMCALLSITAANAGITLTAANIVVFAELHWNPSILSQAESRAHRIGQQNEVQVRYLLADGTADDYIWPMLLEKQEVLSEAGLSKDSFKDVNVFIEQKIERSPKKQKFIESWLNSPAKEEQKPLDSWIKSTKIQKMDVMPSCTQMSTSLLMDDNDDLFLDIDIQE